MTFEHQGRSPAFETGHAPRGAEPTATRTRADEAQQFAQRLEQDVRAVEQSLAMAKQDPDELRRRLKISTHMRSQAAALAGEAAPAVQARLQVAFLALDGHEARAQTLIGWVPRPVEPARAQAAADRLRVPLDAAGYFSLYERGFLDAIRARIAAASVPAPHQRLVWATTSSALAEAFVPALEAAVGLWELGKKLPALVYPVDPFELIDRHRTLDTGRPGETVDGQPARGAGDGGEQAARALAIEVEGALRRSLPRMGLRYVAAADDFHGVLAADALVASHPFDRITAHLVCDPKVARFVPRSKGARRGDLDRPEAFKDGLRPVQFEWQGARDPKLWNWVRVIEPLDARPEELCAWLFERNDGNLHTEYAYALVAAPPFFRVPPRWARDVPEAAAHRPTKDETDGEAASALALVDSRFADDAARAQAGAAVAKVDREALRRTLHDNRLQLQAAAALLGRWQLQDRVGSALRWVARHEDELVATPEQTLGVWAAIAGSQNAILRDAIGDLLELAELATTHAPSPAAGAGAAVGGGLDASSTRDRSHGALPAGGSSTGAARSPVRSELGASTGSSRLPRTELGASGGGTSQLPRTELGASGGGASQVPRTALGGGGSSQLPHTELRIPSRASSDLQPSDLRGSSSDSSGDSSRGSPPSSSATPPGGSPAASSGGTLAMSPGGTPAMSPGGAPAMSPGGASGRSEVSSGGGSTGSTSLAKPVRAAIEAVALAIGESHLRTTVTAQLAAAKQLKARLSLALLGEALHDNRTSARELAEGGAPGGGWTAIETNRSLEIAALDLRGAMVAGRPADQAALEATTVATAEATLDNRLHAIDGRAGQIVQAIEGTPGIHVDLIARFRPKLAEVQRDVRAIHAAMRRDAMPSTGARDAQAFAAARRAAVDTAQAALDRLAKDRDLEALFRDALDRIEHAQIHNLIADAILLIGLSIVGVAAGAWVGGVVRGSMLARAAVDSLEFAQVASRARALGAAANVVTEAAVNAGGQRAVTGADSKLAFTENLLTTLLTLGVMRPLHSAAARLADIDRQARGMWRVVARGQLAFAQAGTMTLEMLAGAGASYVASQILHGSPPQSEDQALSWALNGATIAVGHFVMRRLGPLQDRLAKLGELGAHLRARVATQEHLARKLMRGGRDEEALLALDELGRIQEDEAKLLDDPAAVARLGLDERQLATLRAGNRAALADTRSQEVAETKLRFHGLEPLADNGLLWKGTRDQIDAVVGAAGRALHDPRTDQAPRHRTAELGGRRITFVEVDPSDLRPATARAAGVAGPDLHTHMMGVTDVGYFIDKIGGGDAMHAFDAIFEALTTANPEAQAKAAHGLGIARATRARLDQLAREGARPAARTQVAREGLTNMLAAGDGTAFDKTYPVRELIVEKLIDRGGGPYRTFARDTMHALADEGIGYSEQSIGLGKLASKFPEQMMRELRAEEAKLGKDVDIRFLAMLSTKALTGERPMEQKHIDALKDALKDALMRGDVIGSDIAGPEAGRFTKEGMKVLLDVYAMLSAAAQARGRPLVLRPHVGEGYHEGHADSAHAKVAHDNLEMLITTLEAMGYSPSKAAKDGVIIRFGHATHASDAQIQRMAKLGVIVEANIGSNVITRAILRVEDHPLLLNMYRGLKTVIGTDAGGVMRTNRRAEYERVRKLTNAFRAGAKLRLEDGRLVSFGELTAEQQARFSVDEIARSENDYHSRLQADDSVDAARRKEHPP